jgi:hypothetical protein
VLFLNFLFFLFVKFHFGTYGHKLVHITLFPYIYNHHRRSSRTKASLLSGWTIMDDVSAARIMSHNEFIVGTANSSSSSQVNYGLGHTILIQPLPYVQLFVQPTYFFSLPPWLSPSIPFHFVHSPPSPSNSIHNSCQQGNSCCISFFQSVWPPHSPSAIWTGIVSSALAHKSK